MNIFFDLDETLIRQTRLSWEPEFLGRTTKGVNFKATREKTREFHEWVKTTPREEIESTACKNGAVVFDVYTDKDEVFIAKIRPGARELVEKLKSLGHRVFVLSSGNSTHQSRVLDLLGFRDAFEAVYGTHENGPPLQEVGSFILVDDSGYSKLSSLIDGFPRTIYMGEEAPYQETIDRHFVEVPHYRRDSDEDADTIDKILAHILAKTERA
jgi:phosphoserine phosphatase